MAEYKCDHCGMGVSGMNCAKCGKEDNYGNLYGTFDKEYNKLNTLLCKVCHGKLNLYILN